MPSTTNESEEDLVQQGQEKTQPKIIHTVLSEAIFSVLENLIIANFCSKTSNIEKEPKIVASYNDNVFVPLGVYKVKIVSFLGNLIPYFKNISEELDKLLVKTKFFEVAFEYLFDYEWNNLYQDALLNLFKKILSKCKKLIDKFGAICYNITIVNKLLQTLRRNHNESNNYNQQRKEWY